MGVNRAYSFPILQIRPGDTREELNRCLYHKKTEVKYFSIEEEQQPEELVNDL
jgi:hypothetical protein